jgi:hypothetical protein
MYQVRSDLLYSCFRLTCPPQQNNEARQLSPLRERERERERELKDNREHKKYCTYMCLYVLGGQSALYPGVIKIILYEKN